MGKSATGGNKKRSSPSDIAYFARRKAGGRDEINKQKRIARHCAKNRAPRPDCLPVEFPKRAQKRPLEFLILSGQPPRAAGNFLARLDGKILTVGTLTECTSARAQSMFPGDIEILHRDAFAQLHPVEV